MFFSHSDASDQEIEVEKDYSGPHLQFPLTLKSLHAMLDGFQKGKVGDLSLWVYLLKLVVSMRSCTSHGECNCFLTHRSLSPLETTPSSV